MENYKHYTVLKETLKIISQSHLWFSNVGPHASKPGEDIENCSSPNIYVKNITFSFFTEYLEYYKKNYFLGCSFKVYEKTYNQRLEDYKKEFLDTDEISFITDELDEGIYNYKFKEFNSDYFDNDTILRYEKLKKQINYSLKKRFEYLYQRAKENGYDLVYNEISPEEDNYFLKHIKQSLETKKEEIKSISESLLLESNRTINETKPPKDLDYLKISVLIAQGNLTMKKGVYTYQNKNFNKKDVIEQLTTDLSIKSIRQYIEATFGADADSNLSNDFFRNETKIRKTTEYCLSNGLAITKKYQSLYDNLNLLH